MFDEILLRCFQTDSFLLLHLPISYLVANLKKKAQGSVDRRHLLIIMFRGRHTLKGTFLDVVFPQDFDELIDVEATHCRF